MTPFKAVYDVFLSQITDDLYLEISPEETAKDLKELLMLSIPLYEFPTHVLSFTESEDIEGRDTSSFDQKLTFEEKSILAQGMVTIWLQRQINSIDKMRQITSGADFKISSQAAHLRQLQNEYNYAMERLWHLQALDSRRRVSKDGTRYESNFDLIVEPKPKRRRK